MTTTYPRTGPITGPVLTSTLLGTWYPVEDPDDVTSPETAAEVLGPFLLGADRERCAMTVLDTKHHVIGVELVSIGSLDHTFMNPREIYRSALIANGAAIVVGHNHPSGDTEPSADDRAVTRRLVEAGRIVGVEQVEPGGRVLEGGQLDHLIFGGQTWTSLARRGFVE